MPSEVAPDVYDLTLEEFPDGRRYRAYLFDWERPTLVDCGRPDHADALFEELDEVGADPERLVITHGDGDHVGAFDAVVERYGAETWVPEQTDGVEADHRYGDGDTIGRFEAVHLPGHGDDNHALVDEAAGVVVTGDAVSGADQRGFEPGRFHLPPAVYSNDLNQAEESLARLTSYEFDVALVFHGSSVLEDASEKLRRYVDFPGKPD